MAKKNTGPVDTPNIIDSPHPVIDPAEPLQRVVLALPRVVLFALLDPSHAESDVDRAVAFGLLTESHDLTALGAIVIAGTDRTALGHKMLAAWRQQHNAEVERKR